ncbi:hypothetical protein ACRYCC_04075 [Actinomadura scrupuli]|uniref:hypothetical protein n=1 Tax=Actinomadura scrupuli TaxID=559629 RepID=UPI003D98C79D
MNPWAGLIGRLRSRPATWVVTVLLAAAAVALQATRWDYAQAYGPFADDGTVGHRVVTPRFAITVDQVRTARSVAEGPKRTVTATGVFLIVTATAETTHPGPAQLATVMLRTHLGDYWSTDVFAGSLLGGPTTRTLDFVTLQPGMPRHGAYVFDVPPGALPGARLVVSDRSTDVANFGFYRRDPVRFSAEAHVDLGLDRRRAKSLTDTAGERLPIPGVS